MAKRPQHAGSSPPATPGPSMVHTSTNAGGTMKLSGVVLGSVIVAGFGWQSVRPSPVRADEIPDRLPFCAQMLSGGCGFGWHVLQGPSGGGYDGDEAHGDCRQCIQGYPCHTDCGASEEPEETRLAYDAAVAAAARGDAAGLVALSESADGYVRVNTARHSVQLLSCDRRLVIANLTLALETQEPGATH